MYLLYVINEKLIILRLYFQIMNISVVDTILLVISLIVIGGVLFGIDYLSKFHASYSDKEEIGDSGPVNWWAHCHHSYYYLLSQLYGNAI